MAAHANTAVVILAAGAGTRMVSDTPKVLHQLAGRTMLSHCLTAAIGLSPQHVVVVLGYQQELITPLVQNLSTKFDYPITIALQDQQWGTGHALRCGLEMLPHDFSGTVLVTSGDTPLLDTTTLSDLIDTHHQTGSAVTVLTTTLANPYGYGRILRTQDGEITEIVEQADATKQQAKICEINSGVYAFDIGPLQHALGQLTSNNAQHEQYLTDVISIVRATGQSVYAQHIDDSALVAGVNDRVQLAALSAELNRRIIETHQRDGVTIIDPSSTWIDIDVRIGRDTVIYPGTQLYASTTIGTHCVIGPDTTLTNVTVGDCAQIIRCHGFDAHVSHRASVGPFAYLRPHTIVHEDGKIGSFVEVKNSTVGRGTKVPHLTYVGDADIGEYSNIGASSVFVNYDGVNKHRTTVGSHVRAGSDTMFIAPVHVGDGAYTGAGTVLRHDVPAGALAISTNTQHVIEDWVLTQRPGTSSAQAAQAAQQSSRSSQNDS